MALEPSVATLRGELTRLQEAVAALHVTVTEDRPARGGALLVDRLDTLLTDLTSTLDEAGANIGHAEMSVQANRSLHDVHTALQRMHELLNRFSARYVAELADHAHVAQLLEMGRERGHGWRQWCEVVEKAIAQCAAPLNEVARATLVCWNELADRLAAHSVSVQATNIGQQITVREDELEIARRAS